MAGQKTHGERPSASGQGPAYRIHTRRLVLRCWHPMDAPLLKAAVDASLEHLRPWMLWAQHEPEDLHTKIEHLRRCRDEFDLGQDFAYGMFNRAETQVLGSTGLHTRVGAGAREIGYWMHKDYINQGLATEAAAALTTVAFRIDKVARIESTVTPTTCGAQRCRTNLASAMRRRYDTGHAPPTGGRVTPCSGRCWPTNIPQVQPPRSRLRRSTSWDASFCERDASCRSPC